jgi:hypothetical protein
MPGGKCKTSRLPEGRSRKQTRQKLKEDAEQARAERGEEQRRRRPRSAPLRSPAQTLRRCGKRQRAARHSTRSAVVRLGDAAAGGGAHRRSDDCSGADRDLLRPRLAPARRRAWTSPRRRATTVWVRATRRPSRGCHRRRRHRSRTGRRGLRRGCDDLRDGLRHLRLGARHARGNRCGCTRRRRSSCARGGRNRLRSQPLRIGPGCAGLLEQLLGADRARIRARYRRSGESADRDRSDEDADAHTAMIGPTHACRYRPPGG